MIDRVDKGAGPSGSLSPFDHLVVLGGQLALRLSDEKVPAEIFDEIARVSDIAEEETGLEEAHHLLLMASSAVARYRGSFHARHAFVSAANLYREQEGRG